MLSIKNWSISTRLLLAFLLVLAPFVGFVSIAGLHFGAIMHSYIRIQEDATVDLKRTSDVMAAADGLLLATEDYLASRGSQEQQRVIGYVTHLHEAFRILGTTRFEGADERRLFDAAKDMAPRMEVLGREIVEPAPFPYTREISAKVARLTKVHDHVDTTLHQLMDIHIREIDDAMRHVSDVGRQVIFVTFVTLAVSALGAVTISVPLAHWLSRPIRAIAQGSRRLAEGDLSQRVETTGGGELGEAAQAFNEMAQRLERSAIENTALYGAARQRAERIAAVNRLTKIISASLDIGAVYETFAAELKRFIPYARMGIVIAEKSGVRFALFQLVGHRLNAVPIGMVWSNVRGTGIEWVMSHRRPHFERDLAKARRFVEDGALLKEGVRSTVRLPLIATGQVIGVLFLDDVEPDRYSEHDLELLIPLGEQLAIAIENSRLHSEMERKVEERTETLRETQAQLIQSGKLAAVGTLAAGVAHELNQPLMIIRGYAQELLTDERVASEEIRDDLRRIEAQTTRMAAIINHLRDFSRESKGRREVTDLNRLVREALAFLGQQLKAHDVVVVQELDPALPTVWVDPLQIEQVLLNLITNARDAMESTGMGAITIRTDVVSGSRVALSVTDTGPGIPEEIRTRIFDPFFTTKEVGKGTGLGLSICHGIIEEHGGALIMESSVADGRGARFTMILPQAVLDETTGERT
ncbi:MAG: HAMP domain-containing protein [Candidatus Methylomirabilis oxygeniifera]|uniref:histidine kinase n=1 Tax=Methylomirabilis oxygeniifera TaxID=671143 RepID=D5MJX3_METO1|nr:MAG: HAMP domain-containing protein [Candidatus Methylomirabilis oxyfera]CBE67556.1 putative Histidine kinase [Candidatus Methylomirabilis oxyfera]